MGRPAYSTREVLEYAPAVRISTLADAGVFSRGACRGTSGGTAEGIEYTFAVEISEEAQLLSGEAAPWARIGTIDIEQGEGLYMVRHFIDRLPVQLGGFRYYFRCSGCGRRVKALYYAGAWACRHCNALVYQLSRDHRLIDERLRAAHILEAKARRLRAGKHPRKANRLLWTAFVYEEVREWHFLECILDEYVSRATIFRHL